jgi:hypothetical protein
MMLMPGWTSLGTAQVNIESRRWHSQDNAVHATIDIGLTLKRGNTQAADYKASGTIGKRTGRHLTFMLGKAEYGTAQGTRHLNNGQGHLRYNYFFSDQIAGELFTQVEYDEFRLLHLRVLGGGGIRLMTREAEVEQGRLFVVNGAWGLSWFYEIEQYNLPDTNPEAETQTHRLSSYVSGRLRVSDNALLALTLYGQPRADDWTDLRSIGEAGLEVELSRVLSLLVSLTSRYDSEPVGDVEEWDISLVNTLRFRI